MMSELTGLNSLITAAMPLLLLMGNLKTAATHSDVPALQQQVISELANFEEKAKEAGCSPRMILAARYCLCTALDEVVLCTDWGSQSIWGQQTLLSLIHKETWGGERFFIILEKMAEEGKQNLEFLELIYLILALGYEGKYYNHDRMVRDEIRHNLFRIIQSHRGNQNPLISPSLSLDAAVYPTKLRYFPSWLIGCLCLSVLAILWLGFNFQTYQSSKETTKALDTLRRENAVTIFQQLHSVPEIPSKRKRS